MPLEIIALWVSPALVFWAVWHAPGILRRVSRAARRRRPVDPFEAVGIGTRPVERLAADLHRLSADLDRVQATRDMPGRVLRLRAFSQAYDDTLLHACRALGVPLEGSPPFTDVERLEAEAALAQQGLRW
ncbi:MAG: hypothetical protein ACRDYU_18665 [Actinomycetes bacterium]